MATISIQPVRSPTADRTSEVEWIEAFLCEKSELSLKEKTLSKIAKAIFQSVTLKSLVKERFESGARFGGWATNGSKGYTNVVSGDIYIGKSGKEVFTLAYECINSQHKGIYKAIGIKFAHLEPSEENREKFADEILRVEASAMLVKCHLAVEMSQRDIVNPYYLEVYENEESKEQKVNSLCKLMKEKGKVHFTKPAYDFYKYERFDEFASYYRSRTPPPRVQ